MKVAKYLMFVIGMMSLASTACIFSDIKDTVDTVNKAVDLLQEIEESGTWTYVGDGLEAIDQAGGFAATLQITEGATNTSGDQITTAETNIRWQITADAEGDAQIITSQNDQRREFIIINKGGNEADEVYLLTPEGEYRCQKSGEPSSDLFATSIEEAFAQYSAVAVGVQAISVAEEDGAETINDFETTKYKLVSKLEEALDILKEFPSEDLRKSIEDVPEFYVNGALYIDQETKALIRFEADYANLEEKKGNQIRFEIADLGEQEDIDIDPAKVSVPCTTTAP
jgi:hypothetical protein